MVMNAALRVSRLGWTFCIGLSVACGGARATTSSQPAARDTVVEVRRMPSDSTALAVATATALMTRADTLLVEPTSIELRVGQSVPTGVVRVQGRSKDGDTVESVRLRTSYIGTVSLSSRAATSEDSSRE
jgi:hypothetical protein